MYADNHMTHTHTETYAAIQAFLSDPINSHHIAQLIMANNPRKSSSFQAQVLDLEPGDSCSRVRAVDSTMPVSRLPEELPILRQQLRNGIAPAVKRAGESTGRGYAVEVGETVMPGGTLYIVAVITCKEG